MVETTLRQRKMNWREKLWELAATLADCWQCADVRGHLVAWWSVVSGKVEVG